MPDKSPTPTETDITALSAENDQLKARVKDLEWWFDKTFYTIGFVLGAVVLWWVLFGVLVPLGRDWA